MKVILILIFLWLLFYHQCKICFYTQTSKKKYNCVNELVVVVKIIVQMKVVCVFFTADSGIGILKVTVWQHWPISSPTIPWCLTSLNLEPVNSFNFKKSIGAHNGIQQTPNPQATPLTAAMVRGWVQLLSNNIVIILKLCVPCILQITYNQQMHNIFNT